MADPKQSLEVLDSWEGGYSFNHLDPGGETYCGISRRNWPNWSGWIFIDQYKQQSTFKIYGIPHNYKFGDEPLVKLVKDFYMDNFWNKQDFKDLVNQDVADKIFQHYVNMGVRAIKFAQHVLAIATIREDGKLGQLTAGALNANSNIEMEYDDNLIYSNNWFFDKYTTELVEYYEELITAHPQLETFRHEWMLRAKTIGKRSL